MSSKIYSAVFYPLSLATIVPSVSPLYCSATPRNTTGHSREKGGNTFGNKVREMHHPLPLCSGKGIQGECPSGEGVNLYSQKSTQQFFTPSPQQLSFLRCFPYVALQFPVMLRDTAGEKVDTFEYRNRVARPPLSSYPANFLLNLKMRDISSGLDISLLVKIPLFLQANFFYFQNM